MHNQIVTIAEIVDMTYAVLSVYTSQWYLLMSVLSDGLYPRPATDCLRGVQLLLFDLPKAFAAVSAWVALVMKHHRTSFFTKIMIMWFETE